MVDTPQGVIAQLFVDGQLRITVTDFGESEANGFSKLKRQQSRAKAKLGREFVARFGGPILARAISSDDATDIIYRVWTNDIPGFEYLETLIGYDENV